ncbi:hypothetical protein CEXT_222961 [Caerostris extrusa]|uniref:Uncharacterized protein n=1 Tax=Caerostris extrusa TaxID=172846 RepID=A0AAV4U703_CAEEX|nr:hypothetical protein CEXT_222961 [Caerostris extrusa]
MPIAEPGFLPGFQQTFDQRTVTINPTAQPSNASAQIIFSKMPHTKEMPSYFSSVCRNFSESGPELTNLISQYSETSVEIPILSIQDAQYNSMNQAPKPITFIAQHPSLLPH